MRETLFVLFVSVCSEVCHVLFVFVCVTLSAMQKRIRRVEKRKPAVEQRKQEVEIRKRALGEKTETNYLAEVLSSPSQFNGYTFYFAM